MMLEAKRILIIENDIDTLSVIYTTLLPLDYAVEAAVEINELRPRLERFQPDLLLLGQQISEDGGQELCNWIKQHCEARVILIGDLRKLAAEREEAVCFDDELPTPINPPELLLKINSLLPA